MKKRRKKIILITGTILILVILFGLYMNGSVIKNKRESIVTSSKICKEDQIKKFSSCSCSYECYDEGKVPYFDCDQSCIKIKTVAYKRYELVFNYIASKF